MCEAVGGGGGGSSGVGSGSCCMCPPARPPRPPPSLCYTRHASLTAPIPCQVYGAVTDNWPTVEPYFNETGSNAPSILPAYQQRELLELSVASVQALGFLQVRGGNGPQALV